MEQTEQGNRLIAEYMGAKYNQIAGLVFIKDYPMVGIDELKFHESWNWLMPVVLKIMREDVAQISIYLQDSGFNSELGTTDGLYVMVNNPDPILAVWECVVQYIKNSKQ